MQRFALQSVIGSLFPLLLSLSLGCGGPEKEIEESLRAHVLFFSNFEKAVDALYSVGSEFVEIDNYRSRREPDGGIPDGYFTFDKGARALSYQAKGNFPYSENSAWSGAVSLWLAYDPNSDPEADFPEPFHIGRKEGFPWDDAVISVDFTKPPRDLRFGCYPNKTQDLTDEMIDQRVIRVKDIQWKLTEWHHIVITWSNFNSGKANAEWALFVDGVEQGRKKGLRQDITWNMEDQIIRFSHYKYTGKIDEIAIFDKMLTPNEAKYLHKPKRPLNELLKKKP